LISSSSVRTPAMPLPTITSLDFFIAAAPVSGSLENGKTL